MDMNVGSIKPSEMPFDPNIGKSGSSQPTMKALLPSSPSEVSLSQDQLQAIKDTKFESGDAMAIASTLSDSVHLSSKVAGEIDSVFKR